MSAPTPPTTTDALVGSPAWLVEARALARSAEDRVHDFLDDALDEIERLREELADLQEQAAEAAEARDRASA